MKFHTKYPSITIKYNRLLNQILIEHPVSNPLYEFNFHLNILHQPSGYFDPEAHPDPSEI